MYYTVRNRGLGNAGIFLVTVRDARGRTVREFMAPGLASGASRTYRLTTPICAWHQVILDQTNLVRESVEKNNVYQNICLI